MRCVNPRPCPRGCYIRETHIPSWRSRGVATAPASFACSVFRVNRRSRSRSRPRPRPRRLGCAAASRASRSDGDADAGWAPHITPPARVKFHGMRDLTFRCLECGGEACPPWTTYCPLCAAERDAILSVDDEGFACELDGRRIVDEGHWLLDFCRHHEWQCFVVSRDPYNDSVRGLRRTCEEENDNSNQGWSRTRRCVTGVPRRKLGGRPF